jgi:hypothetical protein
MSVYLACYTCLPRQNSTASLPFYTACSPTPPCRQARLCSVHRRRTTPSSPALAETPSEDVAAHGRKALKGPQHPFSIGTVAS